MLWKSDTLSQRQWKGEPPCVQITGYVSVCAEVWLILTLFQWMTGCTKTPVYDIQIHMLPCPKGLGRERCWTGTGAIEWVFFYEWYHVGVSEPFWEVCLWRSGSRRLVPMVYVCLQFPENMPTHVPHFRGVWFHMPAAELHCWLSCYHVTLRNLPFVLVVLEMVLSVQLHFVLHDYYLLLSLTWALKAVR